MIFCLAKKRAVFKFTSVYLSFLLEGGGGSGLPQGMCQHGLLYKSIPYNDTTRRGLISQETEGMLLDELSAFKVTAAPRVATWRKVNKLGMEVEHVYMF